MNSKEINYITLVPFGKDEFSVHGETNYGQQFEFSASLEDKIGALLEKASDAQSPTEKKLAEVSGRLDTAEKELSTKTQHILALETEVTGINAKLNKTEEKFKSVLENLITKVDWSKLNFGQFEEACGKLALLSVGDGVIFKNHKYIVKKEHMPDPDETPDEREDLYFPLDVAVKEALIELVQGRKYEKGTVGSFRGTVYRCEVANNTAPIGTPGYWTNLGSVANYK